MKLRCTTNRLLSLFGNRQPSDRVMGAKWQNTESKSLPFVVSFFGPIFLDGVGVSREKQSEQL